LEYGGEYGACPASATGQPGLALHPGMAQSH